ncbi:MAG: Na+/H+ antiporter subunit G [Bacteroidetes bacterium HGW-Bacteroidetes-11]|jgi:multicomponent Na+:H+ antiporter subunit G|nr:MAG: Na+/H+ antiporter subunit G [Bacteroidetes bacterium HGW-Bacteroidetes-11]
MISNLIVTVFVLAGAFFSLLAAIGVIRFPDVYTRMHAATKAPAFGILLFLIASVFFFADLYTTAISLMIVVFIFLTAPVASHIISRVAHLLNTEIWSETSIDELASDTDISGKKSPAELSETDN